MTWPPASAAELLRAEAPGYDPVLYLTEHRTFPSADGTPVPATIMRHRDTPLDGTAPCLVYGYGSYEAVFEPEWDPGLPGLLDRGVVYVYAHIRGGGEGGRQWYLDGKLAAKQHTFDDHVAVADGLASAGLVDGARIATRGLSAGGLLQAVVFSQRPEPLVCGARGGPLRGRRDHDVRRDDSAHGHRMGGVGRPTGPQGVRLDVGLRPDAEPPIGRQSARPTCHRRPA